MCANGKMRPVETIPVIRKMMEKIKKKSLLHV
jgi:hypothetical protein